MAGKRGQIFFLHCKVSKKRMNFEQNFEHSNLFFKIFHILFLINSS